MKLFKRSSLQKTVIEKPKTHYAMCWADFKNTNEYQGCVDAMIIKGMKQPYIDNILKGAFAAGYNCPKVFET